MAVSTNGERMTKVFRCVSGAHCSAKCAWYAARLILARRFTNCEHKGSGVQHIVLRDGRALEAHICGRRLGLSGWAGGRNGCGTAREDGWN